MNLAEDVLYAQVPRGELQGDNVKVISGKGS